MFLAHFSHWSLDTFLKMSDDEIVGWYNEAMNWFNTFNGKKK